MISVGDDFRVRRWREGKAAQGLRLNGEAEAFVTRMASLVDGNEGTSVYPSRNALVVTVNILSKLKTGYIKKFQ